MIIFRPTYLLLARLLVPNFIVIISRPNAKTTLRTTTSAKCLNIYQIQYEMAKGSCGVLYILLVVNLLSELECNVPEE